MKKYITILLLLAGCAGPSYTKPGVATAQAKHDQQACNYEAEKATAATADPMMKGMEKFDISNHCMQALGYQMAR